MIQNNTYNLHINKNQLITLIDTLESDDKIEILNKLREDTYLKRFKKLLGSTKDIPLSIDEITKEVEKVRQKRYDQGKHGV